jgi:hypothetical protein
MDQWKEKHGTQIPFGSRMLFSPNALLFPTYKRRNTNMLVPVLVLFSLIKQ